MRDFIYVTISLNNYVDQPLIRRIQEENRARLAPYAKGFEVVTEKEFLDILDKYNLKGALWCYNNGHYTYATDYIRPFLGDYYGSPRFLYVDADLLLRDADVEALVEIEAPMVLDGGTCFFMVDETKGTHDLKRVQLGYKAIGYTEPLKEITDGAFMTKVIGEDWPYKIRPPHHFSVPYTPWFYIEAAVLFRDSETSAIKLLAKREDGKPTMYTNTCIREPDALCFELLNTYGKDFIRYKSFNKDIKLDFVFDQFINVSDAWQRIKDMLS